MNEYIILNRTTIQQRIEELKKLQIIHSDSGDFPNKIMYEKVITEKLTLQYLLSQSTPLIPEIKKAFDEGAKLKWKGILIKKFELEQQKQNYISNLKLDI